MGKTFSLQVLPPFPSLHYLPCLQPSFPHEDGYISYSVGRLKIQSYEQKKKTGGGKKYLKMAKMSKCLQGVFSSANLERSLLWLDVCVRTCVRSGRLVWWESRKWENRRIKKREIDRKREREHRRRCRHSRYTERGEKLRCLQGEAEPTSERTRHTYGVIERGLHHTTFMQN